MIYRSLPKYKEAIAWIVLVLIDDKLEDLPVVPRLRVVQICRHQLHEVLSAVWPVIVLGIVELLYLVRRVLLRTGLDRRDVSHEL